MRAVFLSWHCPTRQALSDIKLRGRWAQPPPEAMKFLKKAGFSAYPVDLAGSRQPAAAIRI
jgi:hypothetical protein